MGQGSWTCARDNFGGRFLLAALMVSTMVAAGGTLFAPPVLAQAAQVTFSIPAGPLNQALAAFGRQSGLQVTYLPSVAAGRTSPGFSGTAVPADALARLLQGTGLSHSFPNPTTVAVTAPAARSSADAAGTIALDTIQVETSPLGPVNGFVAANSITATKTSTPLIETPQTITVITREQMDAQQAQTVRQALRYAPGVYFSDDADFRLVNLMARGFQLDQYQDGLLLSGGTWSMPRVDPYFLERMEVLQGPSSVLFGKGSPAGVLNMVSKRPTSDPIHEIQLQTGSFDRLQAAFDFGGQLDKDGQWLYRITGLARDSGTQVNFLDEQRLEIAPSLTWRPDADTKLTILTSYLDDPKAGFWNLLPIQGTLLPNPYGQIPRDFFVGDPSFEHFSFKQASAGYEFEHRFDNVWTVRQNLRYQNVNVDYQEVQGASLAPNYMTLSRSAYTANEDLGTFAVDTRAEANFATGALQHTLLLGLDYQHKDWDYLMRWGAAPSLNIWAPNYNQVIPLPPVFQNAYQTASQTGVYVQDQMKFQNWNLVLGGRYDWADSDTFNRLNNVTTLQNDDAFSGRAGLLYLFDNGVAPYVSYSTSFQPVSGLDINSQPFQPSTGEQYEVGIKYQPAGLSSYFTASVFDLTQQNVLTPNPINPNFNVQTGAVNSRGVELSAVGSLADGLSFRASYTYLVPEISSANDGTQGNDLANTPRNMASIWLDYTIKTGTFAGLGLGGGVKYVGDSYTTNANTQVIPAFTLVDAALRYDFGYSTPNLKGLKLAANVSNLFDTEYVSACTLAGCRWGMGRVAYLTLTYDW
ncbi:TonB-dependent siderophore receptor [Aquabacter sp. CN5-332]|uniref:TonB-dependent siderophore receptor n=1 Tax=Aquabacter sp. CN5-332 TaxID=3156608 RepID=UPI0032B4D5A4